MRVFERALTTKLRSIATLVTVTGYTAAHPSIAMGNPVAGVMKPGLFIEADHDPIASSDSSALKDSQVSFWAIGADRATCIQIHDEMEAQFWDQVTKREKRFDFSDVSVQSIGSVWLTRQEARKNDNLDCFEALVLVRLKWCIK